MKVIGPDSSPVRSPLTDLTPAEVEELAAPITGLEAGKFAELHACKPDRAQEPARDTAVKPSKSI